MNVPIELIRGPEGYARLFRTLSNEGHSAHGLFKSLYFYHTANINSYNRVNGTKIAPIPYETFTRSMVDPEPLPYKTMTQTHRSVEFLRDNIDDTIIHEDNMHSIGFLDDLLATYKSEFRSIYALDIRSRYTSYRLCADSLDPSQIEGFTEPTHELAIEPARGLSTHKLVYICAPLRGDNISTNIAHARGYARKLFEQGILPVCPHMYFPQIADPGKEDEDGAAMDMALELLRKCDEVHVLGDKFTTGMQREVNEAVRLDIKIVRIQVERDRAEHEHDVSRS